MAEPSKADKIRAHLASRMRWKPHTLPLYLSHPQIIDAGLDHTDPAICCTTCPLEAPADG